MESGQLKSGSIDIFNLPTIFYQISNTPTTEYEMTLLPGHFSENITLKLHVTFCRTSRVISPKLCHALFSMSRVKSGEFCHGQCHALLFGQKRVTGTFRVTGVFSEKCHGLVKKCHGEKKTMQVYVLPFQFDGYESRSKLMFFKIEFYRPPL